MASSWPPLDLHRASVCSHVGIVGRPSLGASWSLMASVACNLRCRHRNGPSLFRFRTVRSIFIAGILAVASASCAVGSPDAFVLQARLARADSTVRWVVDSAVVGDFDCDGLMDSAFVGRAANRISVGIVRGSTPTPTLASFGVRGSAIQEDASSSKAVLKLESIDFDPKADIGELDGFERSPSCHGLNLGDGDSDSMHLYWNHRTGQLSAWRR